jgi:hypothetical protein
MKLSLDQNIPTKIILRLRQHLPDSAHPADFSLAHASVI